METYQSNGSKTFDLKKWLPGIGLAILTISLMFFFKFNKNEVSEIIEEGKANIASFYTQNLKPLLFKTDITNEDVFNFAMYKNLPIDKEKNNVIQISDTDGSSGSDVIEIKPAVWKANTDNYKSFVNYLGVNENQKAQLDSILNSYKDDLYTSVLVNQNNTVAVNPNITHLRDAILADLITFADRNSKTQLRRIVPNASSFAGNAAVQDMIASVENDSSTDYIFFTPDTIFKEAYAFDKAKFRFEVKNMESDLANLRSELKKIDFRFINGKKQESGKGSEKLNYTITDSNSYRVVLPRNLGMAVVGTTLDQIQPIIENVTKSVVAYTMNFDTTQIKFNGIEFPDAPIPPDLHFEYNLEGLEELEGLGGIISNSINIATKYAEHGQNWTEFGLKMDSMFKNVHTINNDSSLKIGLDSLMIELKKMKAEIKKEKDKND
ncbi:MAG: hypothetical protein K9H48_12890 [Melioribacteraceae bacterium]|nr:hypothetical protein [Melioribacteraceae bacterium]